MSPCMCEMVMNLLQPALSKLQLLQCSTRAGLPLQHRSLLTSREWETSTESRGADAEYPFVHETFSSATLLCTCECIPKGPVQAGAREQVPLFSIIHEGEDFDAEV